MVLPITVSAILPLVERLGRVAGLAGGVVVIGSLVAYHAERPANPRPGAVRGRCQPARSRGSR